MAVLFWDLVKSDASVRYGTVAYTGRHVLQGTRNTRPCMNGHPVW